MTYFFITATVRDEDDKTKDAVDEGEDKVQPQVLLIFRQGAKDKGGKSQGHPQEQRLQHPSGRLQLTNVRI